MNAIEKAIDRSKTNTNLARQNAVTEATKMASLGEALVSLEGGVAAGLDTASIGKYQHRYGLFRGWLYSAINAIASKGAGQPTKLGLLVKRDSGREQRHGALVAKMTERAKAKATKSPRLEVEVIEDHPILEALERPNYIQDRWQFVYSFISNLALTGWSYIIFDANPDGKIEMWSIPTTWVTPLPDENGNPFSRFKVKNPRKGDIVGKTYDKDQVAFAYLPNPSDPLAAYAPSSAQISAIKIDDKIQASQDVFFDNGIFPSAVVTVGSNPHPEVPGGIRPRLTASQRRQVHGVINRMMKGVNKYGAPAIVDGYIESIDKFSMTQNEMGWDKSEDKTRRRILSSYGVHPYILGEPVGVGGYAQVAGIERVFCDRVNTYLNMLGNVLTNKFSHMSDSDRLLIWWEQCEPLDPNVRNSMLKEGRKNGDITRDEFRAELGYTPIEEASNRSKLLENPVVFSSMLKTQSDLGMLDEARLASFYMVFLGITEEEAHALTGVSEKGLMLDNLQQLKEIVTALKSCSDLSHSKELVETRVKSILEQANTTLNN